MDGDERPWVTVLGSINMDVVVRTARFPLPGETILASSVERHGGGKGANQALAASRAGANVRLIGSVGSDADGEYLLSMLQESGVDCAQVRVDPTCPTGRAYVTVNSEGQNQIIVAAGANADASAGEQARRGVLLAQLEVPLDAVSCFLEQRRDPSITILNAAPYREGARPIFSLADLLVLNETELAAYWGCSELPSSDEQLIAAARCLLSAEGQRIVVTLGERGSLTVGHREEIFTPCPPASVVDSTGAGDCFCGFLAAELAAGHRLSDAIATAHCAATLAVGIAGASSSIPTMSEVMIRNSNIGEA